MKRILLGACLAALATTSLSSTILARTLNGIERWEVRKVSAETPYCTASRQFEAGANFILAKNIKGEGTLALKFDRNAFDATRPYPIKINVGGQERHFAIKPATSKMLVLRLGQDQELLNTIATSNNVQITIDNEVFALDMSDYPVVYQDLKGCLGQDDQDTIAALQSNNASQTGLVQQNKSQDQNNEISSLLEENRRLTLQLDAARRASVQSSPIMPDDYVTQQKVNEGLLEKVIMAEQQNVALSAQVRKLENDLVLSRQSVNPDLTSLIQQKDAQLNSLKQQNRSLRVELATMASQTQTKTQGQDTAQMKAELAQLQSDAQRFKAERDAARAQIQNTEPEIVIKEVVKEVPIIPANMDQSDAEIVAQLAEVQTQANIFRAERDEYRRLLQTERQRAKNMGAPDGIAQTRSGDPRPSNMIAEIAKLEAEKVDLQRQLAYTKSLVQTDTGTFDRAANNAKINELVQQLAQIEQNFLRLQQEKSAIEGRLTLAENRASMAEQKLASATVTELADMQPAARQSEAELKTLRAELAALEAQNKALREDIILSKQIRENTVQVASLPDAETRMEKTAFSRSQPVPLDGGLRLRPTVTPSIAKLSGNDIRKIVHGAKIPLASPIDRVERVSGPDFAAFTWDTGVVYGSAEQSRMSNMGAFDKSVQQYIQKTHSRCTGSFDQTIIDKRISGKTVRAADIACVDANGQGAAASILFFVHQGMFYAMAHEADMNSFNVAMDMRDRLGVSISKAF